MITNTEIVVVGKGIVGLSAAIAMRRKGFGVILLDKAPKESKTPPSPRVYAINSASVDLFKELNIWQHIAKEHLADYTHMHVWDAANERYLDFDSRAIGCNKLGFMLVESVVKDALLIEAEKIGVESVSDCTVTDVQELPDRIKLIDSKNQYWLGKLLIVADGARSAIRDMLGVKVTSWPYYQQAIVANVLTEKPHNKTAYQVFQKFGPLAFLPMANQNQSSIVWSTTKEHATDLMQMSDLDFANELTKIFANKLGRVAIASHRFEYSLHMRHVQNYSGKNWLIMGDAAHTIHPLAGLGLNVGLGDVKTWINLLEHNSYGFVSKRNLSSYQRKRKHALWIVICLMQGLHLLFTNHSMIVSEMRGFSLNLVNQIAPLKKLIIEHAAGFRTGVFGEI
ncbi:MAG: hypothetical protein A3E88_00040 [Legionellales bacterium RIFCSPHIGHO2_12_FULL_35_11]|nr:MAG: hypothetical protein A3E88_00040 [Legionellales bacterium RIFCSPHIGHO2_12_FULL_35_11]